MSALAPQGLGGFDHYLTARWQLYTTLGPVLARSTVEHERWPLHRATVRELDTTLLVAAGLPALAGEPVVHWSPGVRTRISGLRHSGEVNRVSASECAGKNTVRALELVAAGVGE